MYDTNYGIYNHLNPHNNRPLASVAFHPGEDVNENSLLRNALKVYIDNDIGNLTKLSLVDYLELPSDVVAIINELCQNKLRENSKTMSQVEQQMSKLT